MLVRLHVSEVEDSVAYTGELLSCSGHCSQSPLPGSLTTTCYTFCLPSRGGR
jgi:hypothetical protein